MVVEVSLDQVRRHRVVTHRLDHRAPLDALGSVAGLVGLADSPPGAALTAAAARVEGIDPGTLTRAVADRELVATWSLRGAPYVFPGSDLDTFTLGVLPPTEAGRQRLVQGIGRALEATGLGMDQATDLVEAAVRSVLTRTRLDITELGRRAAPLVVRHLSPGAAREWQAAGVHAPGQSWGEAIVHFCVRLLCLRQVVALAPRTGRAGQFVLVEEWLPGHRPRDPMTARAELTRHYLRAHGPASRAGLASWLGVLVGQVDDWWELLGPDLSPVRVSGLQRWFLTADLDRLLSAPPVTAVRLLPPSDPYLQGHDRDLLVHPRHHRQLWRAVGAPGAVLANGDLVGTWRARKAGTELELEVSGFGPLPAEVSEALAQEASRLARVRAARKAVLTVL